MRFFFSSLLLPLSLSLSPYQKIENTSERERIKKCIFFIIKKAVVFEVGKTTRKRRREEEKKKERDSIKKEK